MKQYTHALIAMLAIKRLDKAEMSGEDKAIAVKLVKWFRNHKDDVIPGAWYPDSVIKDMSSSHILKHMPDPMANPVSFRKLPDSYQLLAIGRKSQLYNKPYRIDMGNLPDRCEAITHSLIDNLKMFESEGKGSTIMPSKQHIAALFFMLSHYIADAHMPLHCDARKFSDKLGIHAKIEESWDDKVRKCYPIDFENTRFYYDRSGNPEKTASDPVIDWVEDQLMVRAFESQYGTGNRNTWDFMSAVTQYSYLTAHELVPDSFDPKTGNFKTLMQLISATRFEELSQYILIDSIDSVSRVWFRAWKRYLEWAK